MKQCTGCGDPTCAQANYYGQTFCTYCVEVAEQFGIELEREQVSARDIDTLCAMREFDDAEEYRVAV
jgi:hypothetical protein